MTQRIEWIDRNGPGSVIDGFVMIGRTKAKIATIIYGTSVSKDKPWDLSIDLPGFRRKGKHTQNAEQAKQLAQAILDMFVREMS